MYITLLMPKFPKELNKWHPISKDHLSGCLWGAIDNFSVVPASYSLFLKEMKNKISKVSIQLLLLYSNRTWQTPQMSCKGLCNSWEAQRETQGVPVSPEGQCLFQSPLCHPDTTGGLTVLILSPWHEQRRSVEFYPSKCYNFRYKNEKKWREISGRS